MTILFMVVSQKWEQCGTLTAILMTERNSLFGHVLPVQMVPLRSRDYSALGALVLALLAQ
jgi:hypothetical protein